MCSRLNSLHKFDDNALEVLNKRYLKDGETPERLLERVAFFLGENDQEKQEFYTVMRDLDFLPNSPTLTNAGKPKGQLSACFVLPVEDSMEGIFDAVKNMALIQKSGGGTGFSFSRLRSKGSRIASTEGVASGVISFMQVFNQATEVIKQGGVRKGANMGILRVNHPDIEDFITCKDDLTQLTNFNISVGMTDDFMKKVTLGHKKETEIFNKIVYQAWKNGEPAMVFLDEINKHNTLIREYGKIEATNPCAELPLLPYEACNLGSINILNMLNDKNELDVIKLINTTKIAVRFLNKVIDKNCYPIPEIDKMTRVTRKIGLGLMGFGDFLYRIGVDYDSIDAIAWIDRIMRIITKTAKLESEKHNFNNSTLTCIAPTGTLSILAGVSSAIEPNFALIYTKHVLDGTIFKIVNKEFEKYKNESWYTKELLEKIEQTGTIQDCKEVPKYIRNIFKVASDITPEWHVKIQASFQSWIDNAVSKTVNLPSSSSQKDVADIFMLAWKMKCKGITVYRDGSRKAQVLQIKGKCSEGECSL
jgi:ribonucleoside-diphosphate reductase alpha chain